MVFSNPLEEAIIHTLRQRNGQSVFDLCKSIEGAPKAIVHQIDLLQREGLVSSRKVGGVELFLLASELLQEEPDEVRDTPSEPPETQVVELAPTTPLPPTHVDAPTTPAIASEEVTTTIIQTPVAVAPSATLESNPGHSNPKEKTSQHTGVCFVKQSHKWRAYIQHHSRPVRIGLYRTEAEAVAARANYIAKNPGAGKSGRPGPKPALAELPVEIATDATSLDSLVGKIVDRMIVAELERRLRG